MHRAREKKPDGAAVNEYVLSNNINNNSTSKSGNLGKKRPSPRTRFYALILHYSLIPDS